MNILVTEKENWQYLHTITTEQCFILQKTVCCYVLLHAEQVYANITTTHLSIFQSCSRQYGWNPLQLYIKTVQYQLAISLIDTWCSLYLLSGLLDNFLCKVSNIGRSYSFYKLYQHTNTRMLTFIIRDGPGNSYYSCVFLCWNDVFSEQIYTSSLACLTKILQPHTGHFSLWSSQLLFYLAATQKNPQTIRISKWEEWTEIAAFRSKSRKLTCCEPSISLVVQKSLRPPQPVSVQYKLYKPCNISTVF